MSKPLLTKPSQPPVKQKSRRRKSVLVAPLLFAAIASSSITLTAQSAQANPFKGVFKGVVRQFKGSGLGIIKTAISNPVGTFRLLNQRVFKIDGTEKYLKYYDKYGQYLKYVPGIGGQAIPANLLIDTAAKQSGLLPNGVPADLNAILDEILGPSKNAKNSSSPNGSSGCFSSINSCKQSKYTTLLDEIQKNAVIASTGALGIPDPTVVRATINESSRRGLDTDKLISNQVVARNFAGNESDRQGAYAVIKSRLSKEGQDNSLARIESLDAALQGVNEAATEGISAKVTQEVMRALLSVETQKAGFLAMQTMQSEQQGVDNALILNQLRNSSQAQDSIRRQRDTKLNAEASRLIHLTRRRIRF